MSPRLVLASASPARLRLLQAAGFAPDVVVSGVDEDDVTVTAPDEVAHVLAVRKAEAVAATLGPDDGALVVGCDSVLDLDGEAVGKPGTEALAADRWRRMRGRKGVLHTGHCVIDTASGRSVSEVASTVVHFASPTDAEIDRYVATGEPLDVAGGFTIDGRGSLFVDAIEGDHGNVIGLSLPLFRTLLRRLDVEVTDLWS